MATLPVAYSFDNDLFRIFATYSTCLIISVMLKFILEVVRSMRQAGDTNTVAHQRDSVDVEVVNSLCFIVLGFFYVGTQPSLSQAARMMRIYFACRIIHVVSTKIENQPVIELLRRFSLAICILINCCMAVVVVREFGKF